MKTTQVMGLGEPEPFGKQSLFQPPLPEQKQPQSISHGQDKPTAKKPPIILVKGSGASDRLPMTLEITKKSLLIIQEYQNRYRMKTGHAIPKWKIISEALELYEEAKGGE